MIGIPIRVILRGWLRRGWGWWQVDDFLLLLLEQKAILLEVADSLGIDDASQQVSIPKIPCKVIDVIADTVPNLTVVLLVPTDGKQHRIAELDL